MTDEQTKAKSNNRDVAALILGALAIALCIANSQKVKVDWIVTTWRMPLIILIAITLLTGMAIGYVAARRKDKKD